MGNKIDLRSGEVTNAALEEELAPVMAEFKEVETCVECSAKIPLNVSEVFYFAQKAVLYPTAPLYDSREHALKPACVDALRRIFRLCDSDKDGVLSDAELNDFQRKCFDAPLQLQELEGIKDLVLQAPITGNRFPYDHLSASGSTSSAGFTSPPLGSNGNGMMKRSHPHLREGGLTLSGFLYLHTLFIQRGRLETTWTVLRTFGYGSDLTLEDSFIKPAFHVPSDCSVELSPHGYQFLTDVFEAHDKDHDGALSRKELENLFLTAPDGKHPWTGTDFPHTTITDEHDAVTLQGWLAQWSMTTLLDHPTTLAYLAYLGYPSFIGGESTIGMNGNVGTPSSHMAQYSTPPASGRKQASISSPSPSKSPTQALSTTSALKLTKGGKSKDKKKNKTQRNVYLAYVFGAAGCGKTALLRYMVGKRWEERYTPTGKVLSVVSAIEQSGGEKYLVLQEFGSRYEAEVLRNSSKLQMADVIVFIYDSSDTNSFSYISNLRQQYPLLVNLPSLFLATKSDLDLVQQRHEVQPEVYCSKLGLRIPGAIMSSSFDSQNSGPVHVSIKQNRLADVFGVICDIAQDPKGAIPGGARKEGAIMRLFSNQWLAYLGAVVLGGGVVYVIAGIRYPDWRINNVGVRLHSMTGSAHGNSGTGGDGRSISSWFSWLSGASTSHKTDL